MRLKCGVLLVALWCGQACAQDATGSVDISDVADADVPQATVDDDGIVDIDAVVVSGVQPGPGLWKVRHGDHVLYILGTVAPLPKGMEWRSGEVASVLREAGVAFSPPGVAIGSDIGMLRGLMLLPSAMKATNNPDGRTLGEILPADLYARWSVLKARYIGRDRGIEKKRPLIAAFRLYDKAVERSGLRYGGIVGPVVEAALKARKMKIASTTLSIPVEDPRGAIADFRKEALKPEDLDCFRRTLDLVERELPRMVERANAWAVGDIDALRAMPYESQYRACLSAWADTETARRLGIGDIDARIRTHWMGLVEPALRQHRVTFAVLPISELLSPDGYLAQFEARGYVVEAP